MTVTPQTNASLAEIAVALKAHDDYVIVGHTSPDGDCIGSQLALWHMLTRAGKKACCVFADDRSSLDRSLDFLPGVAEIIPAACREKAACVLTVDVPTRERMGEHAARLHREADFTVTLDHHEGDKALSQLNYVDPDAAASTLIVWALAQKMGVRLDGDLALCTFTGLVTDTGRFQYQSSNAAAFASAAEMVEQGVDVGFVCERLFQRRSLAALKLEQRALSRMEIMLDGALALTYINLGDFQDTGAVKTDADNVVNLLRSLEGVRVACVLRESEGSVRGSLRAKDGTDVSLFARKHKGGGHKAAAGMTLSGSIETVFSQMKIELEAYLEEAWRGR